MKFSIGYKVKISNPKNSFCYINQPGEVIKVNPYEVRLDNGLSLLFAEDELEFDEQLCKYCTQLKSLYFSNNHDNIREVYVELDGTMSISHWCQDEMGDVNFEINYCPMCGEKLNSHQT